MDPDLRTVSEVRGTRGSARKTVFLDGERWQDVPSAVLRALGVTQGQLVDPHKLQDAIAEAARTCARERAYRLLGYRDRSSAELRGRLLDDGYTPSVVDELVAALVANGIIDDERLARTLASSLVTSRGFGRHRALRAMTLRGVADELAHSILDELAPADSERERACEAAVRLRRTGDTPIRLAGRLARRGFDSADAFRAASAVLEEQCERDVPDERDVT